MTEQKVRRGRPRSKLCLALSTAAPGRRINWMKVAPEGTSVAAVHQLMCRLRKKFKRPYFFHPEHPELVVCGRFSTARNFK